jgi:TP901 family phage tail tape measure protein
MATQTTTLRVNMIDGVSGPGAAAGRALNQLGLGATNLRGLLGSLGLALGAAELARFGKEAVTAYAEHERGLERLQKLTGQSAENLKELHDRLVQIAMDTALPAPAVANLESTLATMTRMGLTLEQSLKALPEVARLAVTAGVEVANLAKLAPLLIQSLHIAPQDLTKAFDAMYQASKNVPGGMSAMVEGLNTLLPQIDRIGWRGQEGLDKLLAYVAGIAPALGDAAPAFSAVADSIATMTTKKLQKRFADAGVDIQQILVEARQRGEDEFGAFIRAANQAVNAVGIGRIFISPEQQKWFKALVQNVEQIDARHKELRNSIGAVAKDAADIMNDSQAKIDRLGTAWTEFKQELGATIVNAGALEYLDKVKTLITEIVNLLVDQKRAEELYREGQQKIADPWGLNKLPTVSWPEWAKSKIAGEAPAPGAPVEQKAPAAVPLPTPAERAPAAVPMPTPAPPRAVEPPAPEPQPAPTEPYLGRPMRRRAAPPPEPEMPPPPEPAPLDLTGAFDTMPEVAKSAGQATGQAYNAALGTELNKSVGMIKSFSDWAGKALGFKASPQIAPSFETAPGTQGPGSKASMLSRGAFSDSGPVPTH